MNVHDTEEYQRKRKDFFVKQWVNHYFGEVLDKIRKEVQEENKNAKRKNYSRGPRLKKK